MWNISPKICTDFFPATKAEAGRTISLHGSNRPLAHGTLLFQSSNVWSNYAAGIHRVVSIRLLPISLNIHLKKSSSKAKLWKRLHQMHVDGKVHLHALEIHIYNHARAIAKAGSIQLANPPIKQTIFKRPDSLVSHEQIISDWIQEPPKVTDNI